MIYWHEAAGAFTQQFAAARALTQNGCSLTAGINGIEPCAPTASLATETALLPAGYNTGTYTWNSVAFSDNGNFIVTYAGPPAGTDGFISTATATLGISDSDLYQQVRQSGVPMVNYGYVTTVSGNKMLITPATINGVPIEYTLPPNVPSGAFALISATSVCQGC